MAQEDYFLALAQLFLTGQQQAAQIAQRNDERAEANAREDARIAREESRYAAEQPFRDAQLQSVLLGNQGAALGVAEQTRKAGYAAEDRAFDVRARDAKLRDAEASVKLSEFNASDAELKRRADLGDLEADAARVRLRADKLRADAAQIALDEASDAELQAASKQGKLAESRLKIGQLDEFLSNKSRRDEAADLEIATKRREYESSLTPDQAKRLNEARVAAAEIANIAAAEGVGQTRAQTIGLILENMRRQGILDGEDDRVITKLVEGILNKRGEFTASSKDPKAVEKFVSESVQSLALTKQLTKKNPEQAIMQARGFALVRDQLNLEMQRDGLPPEEYVKRLTAATTATNRAMLADLGGGDASSRPASRPTEPPAAAPQTAKTGFAALSEMMTNQRAGEAADRQAAERKGVLDEYAAAVEELVATKDDAYAKLSAAYQKAVGKPPADDQALVEWIESQVKPARTTPLGRGRDQQVRSAVFTFYGNLRG